MKVTIEITHDDDDDGPRPDVINAIRYELKEIRGEYCFTGRDLSDAIDIVDQRRVSAADWRRLRNHLTHVIRALPDKCLHRRALEDELWRAEERSAGSSATRLDAELHARVVERALQDRRAMLVQRGFDCEVAFMRYRLSR